MKLLSIFVVAVCMFAGVSAEAATKFTIAGDFNGSFVIGTNQLPDSSDEAVGLAYYDQPFADVSGLADFVFYAAGRGGWLDISDFYANTDLLQAPGPQLYSGSAFAPVFAAGTYNLTQFEGPGRYTLTIASIPEPTNWALLAAGFGLVGTIVRRQRTVTIPGIDRRNGRSGARSLLQK